MDLPHSMPQAAQEEDVAVSSTPREQVEFNRHPDHPPANHSSIRPLIFTLFFVGIVVGIKLLVKYYGKWSGVIDPADLSILITGLFFILGQMLSNLNADYKEAEKLPSDIVSSLEQLDDHFMLAESKVADKGCSLNRDVRPIIVHLTEAVLALMEARAANAYAVACHDLHLLMMHAAQWDKKGAANTAPVPTTIDKIRRSISRGRVISRTSALPVGQTLLLFFVLSATVVIFLTTFKTDAALVVFMIVIYTVTWLLCGAIRSMDDPFDSETNTPWGTLASVDMFPLSEFIIRIKREMESPSQLPAPASRLPELE